MKVTLFGATGYTGNFVLKQLLKEGHTVTALVRSPEKLQDAHKNLSVVAGDVLDESKLLSVISGQEAVINCLGLSAKGDGSPTYFLSTATEGIVGVMEEENVQRFICLSNTGAGDSEPSNPWFFRKIILPYFMKWLQAIIDDKNRMEPIVMKSSLNWTIVRCPRITLGKAKDHIRTSPDGKGLGMSVTAEDTATFVVKHLTDHTFDGKVVSISN